jgi:serine phosphatase RsbU (regulator of sigma subunit)
VNQLYENTVESSYALFFAEYDTTRRLRCANCGHLPALLSSRTAPSKACCGHRAGTSSKMGLLDHRAPTFPGDTLVFTPMG